ncbi:MAG: glycosyltransferase [Acidimicrobiia bacterium]
MNIITIGSFNYLGQIRVLARTFTATNPGCRCLVYFIDEVPEGLDLSAELFEVLPTEALPISQRELHLMATIYDVTEYATSVKPWVLEAAMEVTGGPICYIDPDIAFYRELEPHVAPGLERHGVVLTPHLRAPMPRDGKMPDELVILRAGVYNLGFIGVAPSGLDVLRWWQERLARDCIMRVEEGYHVDQKWIDLVPAMRAVEINRSPALNLAYWNIHEFDLSVVDGVVHIADEPLAFFHFSGFDPERDDRLSKHEVDRPRRPPRDHPVLAQLCRDYAQALQEERSDMAKVAYGYNQTPDGLLLDASTRNAIRARVLEEEQLWGTTAVPDAFTPDGGAQINHWYQSPMVEPRTPARPVVLLPSRNDRHGRGVNLVGHHRHPGAAGQLVRSLRSSLDAAGIEWSMIDIVHPAMTDALDITSALDIADGAITDHPVTVLCIDPLIAADLDWSALAPMIEDHHTIGYWNWHPDAIEAELAAALCQFDETWTTTRQAATLLRAVTGRAVESVAPAVAAGAITRRGQSLRERPFTFLTVCDVALGDSHDPQRVMDAFSMAFGPGESYLIVKTINGELDPVALGRLQATAARHRDIDLVDTVLDVQRHTALLRGCDALVSLHRWSAASFTVCEAMGLGRPVLAMDHGGAAELLRAGPGQLVACTLESAPSVPGAGSGAHWAVADTDAAARVMRAVFEIPETAEELGREQRAVVMRDRSPVAAGQWLGARLARHGVVSNPRAADRPGRRSSTRIGAR